MEYESLKDRWILTRTYESPARRAIYFVDFELGSAIIQTAKLKGEEVT